MSNVTVRLVRAAFVCLALGVGLGICFAFDRALGPGLRPLHAELNLWGWATLLIYGMGYHMVPRFAGRPLRWPRLVEWQAWLAIGGTALTSGGWVSRVTDLPFAPLLLLTGALFQLIAALLFALLIGGCLISGSRRGVPTVIAAPRNG